MVFLSFFAFRVREISAFGTATRRRVSSVMRSSGVLGFGVGFVVIVFSCPVEGGVCSWPYAVWNPKSAPVKSR